MKYSIHYGGLKFVDMLDGPGLRVTLFVSGCCNCCKNCQNQETWDPNYGKQFTEDTLTEIVNELKNEYYKGFTLCGGDPLYHANRKDVCNIARTIKAVFGDTRSIWMYTGYTIEDIDAWDDPDVNELFDYVDVVLDGPYIEELKSPEKPWVGSSNQRMFAVSHCEDGNHFTLIENEISREIEYQNKSANCCCS